MNRLTHPNYKIMGFHSYIGAYNPFVAPMILDEILAQDCDSSFIDRNKAILFQILNRLAEYEDSGLSPHQINKHIQDCIQLNQRCDAYRELEAYRATGFTPEEIQKRERAKVIAVDFDGTLVTNKYPDIGEPIESTINRLRFEQDKGAKVILWTCRCGEQLEAAVKWCEDHGIHLDAVNENLPETIAYFGSESRKISCDEYWDDRAVRIGANEKERE